jgi:ABC-type polysaccharide/polyol phosphate transport system ATPase subunit
VESVEVVNISKHYTLGNSQWTRMRRIFSPVHPSVSGKTDRRDVRALHDVSFSVAEGEAFGIIGANGSGKSTLLQIVAGILRPTSGSVRLNGRCSTLLELGSGFAPEFTGRQNVNLNATILGLSQQEIEEKFDAIHRFSGIGDFIDQPIRTYSTGMVLRLAFAVVAHSDPRILIVDEALAVGDVAFRQRCMRRIHEMRAAGVTILFVSHDTTDIKALCERCLWLEHGIVRGLGEADEIVASYLATTLESVRPGTTRNEPTESLTSAAHPHAIADLAMSELPPGTHRFGNGAAEVTGVSLPARAQDANGSADLLLRLYLRGKRPVAAPIAGFLVRNQRGENIFGTNSARENHPLPRLEPGDEYVIDFHAAMPRLAHGTYSISVAISDGSIGEFEVCDYIEDAVSFGVAGLVKSGSSDGVAGAGYLELPCRAVAIHRN